MRVLSLLCIVMIILCALVTMMSSLDELSKPKGLMVGADCTVIQTGEEVSLVSIKGPVAHVLKKNGVMVATGIATLDCDNT